MIYEKPQKANPFPNIDNIPDADNFYALSLEDRRKLTANAISSQSTILSRWLNLSSEKTDHWMHRAKQAILLLGEAQSVVDLGCGTMAIEPLLSKGVRYIPVDVVRRDERTLIVDLNHKIFPEIKAEAMVGLGILEYIHDVAWLLSELALRYKSIVLSYNCAELFANIKEREGHGWVNNMTTKELEFVYRSSGLQIQECHRIDDMQQLWKLRGL